MGSAQERPPESNHVGTFVFFQPTGAHRARSRSKDFLEIVSGLLAFLKSKNVMLAEDSFRDSSFSEHRLELARVKEIAKGNGADYLLYTTVDYPFTGKQSL